VISGRRCLLTGVTASLMLPLWRDAQASTPPSAIANALAALGIQNWQPSNTLHLGLPDVAENGALVPVEVSSSAPDARRIVIAVEGNPIPVVADFRLDPGVLPWIEARIKLAQSTHVVAFAQASGQWHQTRRYVRVIAGGCGQG
jgi:sulfur-oxidizing protein SoxY